MIRFACGAAPLASGISICGVSAAIVTGAAIRARPVVPIMVSSLVVIFSVVELLILPLAPREFLWREPLVAAAWMGLAVKTDGAAVASGVITDAMIRSRALEAGVAYEAGWILTTTTTLKVFIDVFIGIWALVPGVCRQPGRLHHLDWIGDLVAVLPWSLATADFGRSLK